MFTLTPWKKKQPASTGNGGASAATEPAPYFLSRMRDEFDRLFDRVYREWTPAAKAGAGWRWNLEVQDEPDRYIVQAEAPGFEPADFDLQVRGDQLVVRAAAKAETKEPQHGAREWREQKYYQTVSLPPGLATDKVEARYHSGVLTVTFPKTEEGKGRRIPIQGS